VVPVAFRYFLVTLGQEKVAETGYVAAAFEQEADFDLLRGTDFDLFLVDVVLPVLRTRYPRHRIEESRHES